jgi:hypothetical protein
MCKGEVMTTKYCTDEQLEQVINTPSTPCAASCGVPLSTLNLINGDTVHEDCRCLYRKCHFTVGGPWDQRAKVSCPRNAPAG